MEGKNILVFGGAGSIGEELVRQLSVSNAVYVFDIDETRFFNLVEELRQDGREVYGRVGNVRDQDSVNEAYASAKPDVVFIASALKHVTPNEQYPEEAVRTNVLGTINILKTAKKLKIPKLIYISTDKVVNANCVMGVTKRLGELIVRNAGYTAVRFGNVMHSRGSVLEIWGRQIAAGEPITITDPDAERYMMSIPDACKLLIRAMHYGKAGEILIMDMGKRVRIGDLAKKFAPKHPTRLIGLRPGESLLEELMTDSERKTAKKDGNFWVLP